MTPEKAAKYFRLAEFQADLFSKDPNTKVCALFIAPESLSILQSGFNGMPRKIDEHKAERWERPEKYQWVSHAEANGICNAARHGISLDGSTAVITLFPCSTCAKLLIQSGIREVVTEPPDVVLRPHWQSDFEFSKAMLEEAGVRIVYVHGHRDIETDQ